MITHKQPFQFSGSNLETFILDQLLQTIHNEHVAILIDNRHITGMEVAITIDTFGSLLWAIEISLYKASRYYWMTLTTSMAETYLHDVSSF